MYKSLISRKMLMFIFIYSLLFFAVLLIRDVTDRRTTVVFCDVGRGDATYIRVRNQIDILVDAGASSLVTSCLGKYMPFYDRTIEYAFLTHIKKSQFDGFHQVLKRYSIAHFLVSNKYVPTASYQALIKDLEINNTDISSPLAHETLEIADAKLSVLWPQKITGGTNKPSKKSSYTLLYTENETTILLIGYIPQQEMEIVAQKDHANYSVVKFSEYGFDTNLKTFLELAKTASLVISMPKSEVNILQSYNLDHKTQIYNIAETGDIVFRL